MIVNISAPKCIAMHVNSGVDVGLGWFTQFTKMHCNAREFRGRGRSAFSRINSQKCIAMHVNSGGGVEVR